uniref:VWFA1-like domain containing protein vWFA105 n=1 Tax=Colubraria reticulata TaxID=604273 RepID=A0A330LAL9_9CAEN|nr:vWFA1-like domain containing protein vWFA105 [Colubraria reticulata]
MLLLLLLPLFMILSGSVTALPALRGCKRDIVFLVDTSSNMDSEQFELVKTFVADVIGQYGVSPSATRVAVVSYSTEYRQEFDLDQYKAAYAMVAAVRHLPFSRGSQRFSHRAIGHALYLLRRQPRDGVERVIIYITSGVSIEPHLTLQLAEKVKQKGILMFSVGVGDKVDPEELEHIATEDTEQFVYPVKTFDGLNNITQSLAPAVCEAPIPLVVPVAPCPRPTELVFLVETTQSVEQKPFELELQFVQDMIEGFDVSDDSTRVAVITYSREDFKVKVSLDKQISPEALLKEVGEIGFTGNSYLKRLQAIKAAYKILLQQSRDDAVRVIICITHSTASDTTEMPVIAERLRSKGILLFAVAVALKVHFDELGRIATEKRAPFIQSLTTAEDFIMLSETFGPEVCKAEPPEALEPCTEPTELVFLLDSTSSIASSNFQLQLEFVTEVIEHKEEFGLDEFNNVGELLAAVDKIAYSPGQYNRMEEAIAYARDGILQNGRADTKRIIIAIFDGKPTRWNLALKEANTTRHAGIMIFVVGVGPEMLRDRNDLKMIAFDNDHFVYTSSDFKSLPDKELGEKACSVEIPEVIRPAVVPPKVVPPKVVPPKVTAPVVTAPAATAPAVTAPVVTTPGV